MIDPEDRRQWPHAVRNYTGAAVRLICRDEVLWVHRRDDKTWAFPGGGRMWEDGEKAHVCAENKLYDEVGLDMQGIWKKMKIWGISNHHFIIFDLPLERKPRITLNREKLDDYKWIPEHATLNPMHEPQREFFWL